MNKYPKTYNIFNRDMQSHKLIDNDWTMKAFEYLRDNNWLWYEKVDGTNTRIIWTGTELQFKGRTDDDLIRPKLLEFLQEAYNPEAFKAYFADTPACIYGEGYGNTVQGVGKLYLPDSCGFLAFDLRWSDGSWASRYSLEDVAKELGISVVPQVGQGTPKEAIGLVELAPRSTLSADAPLEGLVIRPELNLSDGSFRIQAKIKVKDFVD